MIPYGRHFIEQDDIDAVTNILQGDWLTCGPTVEKFENKLAEVVATKHAVACSNGTTALHLAMLALNITDKDTVLVPAISFLASANAARYVGADVVFVDIDPTTGLMTAETLEEAILANQKKNLKAIVNVHLAGQCENLEAIHKVTQKYNLLIIEDAAHAIGTKYVDKDGKEHQIGANSFSNITTFSFHPVKTIAMGEGGAVTTNDANIAKKLRTLRSHNMLREKSDWKNDEFGPWYYEMQELGYNDRISDINCALGLSQLEKLDRFKIERSRIVQVYDTAFNNIPHITPVKKLSCSDTAWHLYVALVDYEQLGKPRTQLMSELKVNGIGTQVHYIPLYKQPYYQKPETINLRGAEKYYSKCLSLPLFVGLSDSQQEKVIDNILGTIEF
jgi:UDP-4-amino-4,6-dideoxy-N-acetyl-beta-L-altrosamine transaminase